MKMGLNPLPWIWIEASNERDGVRFRRPARTVLHKDFNQVRADKMAPLRRQ
jgi:hypothetical protein